jgi:hypothetical protein
VLAARTRAEFDAAADELAALGGRVASLDELLQVLPAAAPDANQSCNHHAIMIASNHDCIISHQLQGT